MKVTRTSDGPHCRLPKAEKQTLERASSLLDQLAYHYRDTDLGDRTAPGVLAIDAVLFDKDIVPTPEEPEQGNNQ